MDKVEFSVRDAQKEDFSFIFATWLRSLYYGNPWFREIDQDTFFKKYAAVIQALLLRSEIKICTLADDENVIVGYCVLEQNTLHWIYTKKSWRKLGIAKLLLNNREISQVSHLTKIGKQLKPTNWRFDPFI